MKDNNEITVFLTMSKSELIKYLNNNNYQKINEGMCNDVYCLKSNVNLNKDFFNLLKDSIIVRRIYHKKYLLYKDKTIDNKGNILKQNNYQIEFVSSIDDVLKFLKMIGYNFFFNIDDQLTIYEKNGLELCIQEVNKKYLLLEIEENSKYSTVSKLILALKESGIEYDDSNYFVKKAELVLNDILKEGHN